MSARRGEADRVAIGRCTSYSQSTHTAARTYTIVDDQLLTQPGAQVLAHETRNAVDCGTRRKRHDEADWLARPARILRARWHGCQRREQDEKQLHAHARACAKFATSSSQSFSAFQRGEPPRCGTRITLRKRSSSSSLRPGAS